MVCAPPADAVYAESSVRGVWGPVAASWRGGQVAVAVAVAAAAGRRRGAAGLAGGERTAVAPAWGEMPDAARAAALSRRAYEAATGRGLGQWSGRGALGVHLAIPAVGPCLGPHSAQGGWGLGR